MRRRRTVKTGHGGGRRGELSKRHASIRNLGMGIWARGGRDPRGSRRVAQAPRQRRRGPGGGDLLDRARLDLASGAGGSSFPPIGRVALCP